MSQPYRIKVHNLEVCNCNHGYGGRKGIPIPHHRERTSFTAAVLVAALFFLCLTSAPARAEWEIEIVDASLFTGSFSSLAFDPITGNPAIAYFDGLEKVTMYASFNGTSWDIVIVDPGDDTDSGGYTGHYTSLAFDPSGQPAISYYHYGYALDPTPIKDLMYAHFNGTSWDITAVDSSYADVGRYTSLAFDPITGNPAISHSYYNYDSGDSDRRLKYSRFDGGDWSSWFIDYVAGTSTSLAFQQNGEPVIAYHRYSASGSSLMYVWNPLVGTTPTTVDAEGDSGSHCSIAISPADWPNHAIAYYDAFPNNDLKYAHHTVSGWLVETVDSEGIVGKYTSLAFDSGGNPAISYYDATNEKVKYARHNGTAWIIENVDDAGSLGGETSLVLDASGNPAISYRDSRSGGGLKLARLAGMIFADGFESGDTLAWSP